jgi:autotransporter-associated beta strand protein
LPASAHPTKLIFMRLSYKTLIVCASVLTTLAAVNAKANIVGPYSPDVNTLHLWHMDQSTVPVLDSVSSGGTNFTVLTNGATLGNASFSGFGTALSAVGPGTLTNGACALTPRPLPSDTALTYTGPNGAFTYEAVVQIQVNPALNLGTVANGGTGRNTALTIMAGEGNANAERLFQFRIDPVGFNPNAGGFTTPLTQPAIEFINVNKATSVQSVIMLIPTTGPDAIIQNGWYHIAVTYNGQPGTANNMSFYWTLMDSSRLSATLLGTATMNLSLASGTPNFVIGNTGRNPGGAVANPLNANFLGLIDEVRMSKIALGPGQMMFSAPTITIDVDVTNQVTVLGQTVNFAVSASGVPPLRYQWRHNSINILGATQAVYTIPAVSVTDVGGYDVVITNNYTSATSSLGNLSLRTPIALTWVGFGWPWDVATSLGWQDPSLANVVYTEGDSVTFDSQGSGFPSVSISGPVYPSSVTVNSDTDYTFTTSAGGGIYGMTGLSKTGVGNLILDVNNSYAGPTVIQTGTIQIGAGGTRGSLGSGAVTNNSGLSFNRTDAFTVPNNIAGSAGLTNIGSGTITLSGTNRFSGAIAINAGGLTLTSTQALGQATDVAVTAGGGGAGITGTRVTLGGGVFVPVNRTLSMLQTFSSPDIRCNLYTSSGTNSWNGPIILGGDGVIALAADAANAELDVNGPISGNPYNGKLTLRGTGGRGFVSGVLNLPTAQVNKTDNSTWTISSTGNSWVSTDIAAGTLRMGANNVMPASAMLNLLGGNFDLGGYSQQIAGLNGASVASVIGSSSTTSDSVLSINAATPAINWGVIQDSLSGGTRKVGLSLLGGSLTLTNINTFSGDTTVSAGTLTLLGAGSIANSATINIGNGATLDVSGRTDAGLTVGVSQTLKGNGAFNVAGNLTNNGTIELKVNKTGPAVTADSIHGVSQIAYGGTLKIDLSGDPLVGGEIISLFAAAGYSGAFANITPATPGPGLAWYRGNLAVDGTLHVFPVPVASSVSQSPLGVTVTGSHGPPLRTYLVVGSSDPLRPRDSWNPIATNTFDINGNFSFTLPIQQNVVRRVFTIKIP